MKRLRFVVALVVAENDYQQLQAVLARETAQRLGADVDIIYAGNDAVAQGQQLLEIIQSSAGRPDGIICHPVGTSLSQVARQAALAGIGWAVMNREADYLAGVPKNLPLSLVGLKGGQNRIGRIQGRPFVVVPTAGGPGMAITGPGTNPAF